MKNVKTIYLFLFAAIFTACSSDDDNTPPTPLATACDVGALNFTQVLDFQSDGSCITTVVTDAVIDASNNVLYFASRGNPGSTTTPDQEVIRIDLDTNTLSKHYGTTDNNFCTTKTLFFDNQLHVASSWHISTYAANGTHNGTTDYSVDPTNPSIYGVGSWIDAAYDYDNDELYFIGVREGGLSQSDLTDIEKVRTYDAATNTFSTVGSLDLPITLMGVEYYDDNLYVFGGFDDDDVNNTPPSDQMQIFNLTTGTTTTETFPAGVIRGFTTQADSCIFLAGIEDYSSFDTAFYKYNTVTETSDTLSHDLPTGSELLAIAATQTKLYVVIRPDQNTQEEFSVYEADLL